MAVDPIFAATSWTLVLRARGETPEARAALSELCETYWNPVFRFLLSEGRTEDAARDLTQEFFTRRLAGSGFESADPDRGRFRSYLLGAVKHFLADVRERKSRAKRGGGKSLESLENLGPASTESGVDWLPADPSARVSDAHFDREWAIATMERGLKRLALEWDTPAKARLFEVLKPWLAGDGPAAPVADAARTLGQTEGATRVAIHRLRKRFGELTRAEIARTLPPEANVEEELRYLIEVLGSAPH